jgi:hypothetical protein
MVFAIIGESAAVSSADIEQEQTSALSLMPEGLLDAVNEKQAIDLFGFLMSTAPPQTQEAKQ